MFTLDACMYNKGYSVAASRRCTFEHSNNSKENSTAISQIELSFDRGDSCGCLSKNLIKIDVEKHSHITYMEDGCGFLKWNTATCEII